MAKVSWKIAQCLLKPPYNTELVEELIVEDLICQELVDLSKRFLHNSISGPWKRKIVHLHHAS